MKVEMNRVENAKIEECEEKERKKRFEKELKNREIEKQKEINTPIEQLHVRYKRFLKRHKIKSNEKSF